MKDEDVENPWDEMLRWKMNQTAR